MINHHHFFHDFTYKCTKPKAGLRYYETPCLTISLWRANRLSLLRAVAFLNLFFPKVTVKKQKIVIRIRRSHKLNKKKFLLIIVARIDKAFFDFADQLIDTRLYQTIEGHALIYINYRFAIRIPFKPKYPLFSYKLISYIAVLVNGKIYKDFYG